MGTGAIEALVLLMHWDGARIQWAVGRGEVCLSAGEEVAVGPDDAERTIGELKAKGLAADEVVWSTRHPDFVLVPESLDGTAAFALEQGGAAEGLRSSRSDRFEDGLTCWELPVAAVEAAVVKAWPGVRIVSGALAWLESAGRRESGRKGAAVYLDASPARSCWSRWEGGKLQGAMASPELLPENVLYQIANALHRDHTDPASTRVYLSGEDVATYRALFGRFFEEVGELEPFVKWEAPGLDLKPARWAALWNLASCAS